MACVWSHARPVCKNTRASTGLHSRKKTQSKALKEELKNAMQKKEAQKNGKKKEEVKNDGKKAKKKNHPKAKKAKKVKK